MNKLTREKRPVGRPEGSGNQLPVGVRLGVIPPGRSGGRFRILLARRAARARAPLPPFVARGE